MYFFYIDESGSKDPKTTGTNLDGSSLEKDWVYVLTAVSVFEDKWRRFDHELNLLKMELLDFVFKKTHTRLELADAEVKSTLLRLPSNQKNHPFFSQLTPEQITRITKTFFASIPKFHIALFSVVVDKRKLHDFMDAEKMHRKAYELLLEEIDSFMEYFHKKHKALIVVDDTSREMNRSIAMKHSYFLREGTKSGSPLKYIIELPFFTASNLSNGVQLADLCAYNIYHAFRYNKPDYPYFKELLPHFCKRHHPADGKIEGFKIFPEGSELELILAQSIGKNIQPNLPLNK
jgi:hypothetical protein